MNAVKKSLFDVSTSVDFQLPLVIHVCYIFQVSFFDVDIGLVVVGSLQVVGGTNSTVEGQRCLAF